MANYICVGPRGSDDEIVVLNTSDPTNISIAGKGSAYYGPRDNLDMSGVFGYCGTNDIFETLDVSNPANPTSPGLVNLNPYPYYYDASILDVIYHQNNYAFVVASVYQTPISPSPIARWIWKVDVSDPGNPVKVAEGDELGFAYYPNNPPNPALEYIDITEFSSYLHITISNDVLYVLSDIHIEHWYSGKWHQSFTYYVVTYSTTNCSEIDFEPIQGATPYPGPVWLIGSGNYLFGALKDENRIWTIDISSSPNPVSYLSITDPYGMDIRGNYLYVACPFYNRIYVVDISSPTSPSIVGQLTDATYLNNASNIKIDPHRDVAYVTCPARNRVTSIDISNPLSLSILGSLRDNVNLENVFTVDADITQVLNPTIDGYITATKTKTFTIDGYVQTASLTKTFTIDAEIVSSGSKTFSIDTIAQKTKTNTFTLDTSIETPAATVATYYYTGSSPGSGEVATNLRFKLADNNTQDINNQCVIPSVGANLSYWKVIALYAITAPNTAINNVKLYTDGALAWTGCTVYVGNETPAAYSQATGGATSGDEMVANYGGGGVITGQTDLFTYNSGATKSITGSIGAATGKITNYVVVQASISSTAIEGVKTVETITWQYDET